jgi:hypothetical protein
MCDLRPRITTCFIAPRFLPAIICRFASPDACYVRGQSHTPWFHRITDVWWREEIIKCLIKLVSGRALWNSLRLAFFRTFIVCPFSSLPLSLSYLYLILFFSMYSFKSILTQNSSEKCQPCYVPRYFNSVVTHTRSGLQHAVISEHLLT